MEEQLQWNNKLASGSFEIDTRNKELFRRINNLLTLIEDDSAVREERVRTTQYLADYLASHFGDEEKYMVQHSYSSMSAHKAQHEQFLKNFAKLKNRLLHESINGQLTEETKELVVDWLVSHIKYSDMALGMFLKKKNNSRPA